MFPRHGTWLAEMQRRECREDRSSSWRRHRLSVSSPRDSWPMRAQPSSADARFCDAPPVVLITAPDAARVLRAEPDFERHILVFADTDALRALEVIGEHRPNLVVLSPEFLATARGATVVDRIRTDPELSHTHIRVLSDVNEYVHLVSQRVQAGLEPETTMPGEPLPQDYPGTRVGGRLRLRPDVAVRLDGDPATLVNMSRSGAQVLVPRALRVRQRVRMSVEGQARSFRVKASVMWVSFERSTKTVQQVYRAGVAFVDADPQLIEAFCARHLQP